MKIAAKNAKRREENNNIKKVVHRITVKINSHKRILPEMKCYFNGHTLKIATKTPRHKETPGGQALSHGRTRTNTDPLLRDNTMIE